MRLATAMAAAVATGALLIAACGPAPGVEARRARLEAQRVHLEASLERLEARLLDGQARVRMWQELRERHAQVSAVACEVNGRHVADMARLEEEERWLAASRGAPRLAAAVAPAEPKGRGGGVPLPKLAPVPEAPTQPATETGTGAD